jgi:hypothetical protein
MVELVRTRLPHYASHAERGFGPDYHYRHVCPVVNVPMIVVDHPRYQSTAISRITTTISYLSALISILSQGLMPRAKFMKIMFYDLLSTCVSASLCCLAVFCAVKAREHNTPESDGFSSDACTVAAIWLIFMIWCVK